MALQARIDVTAPLWDQRTFYGRCRHFFWMTNPLNVLHSTGQLNDAKELLDKYKIGAEPPGTTEAQVETEKKKKKDKEYEKEI